jgi:hypothetical protein
MERVTILLRLRDGDLPGNARAINGLLAAHRAGATAAKFDVIMEHPSAPSLLGEAGLAIMRDEPGAFDLFPRLQFALLFGSARWLLASYATMLAEAGDGIRRLLAADDATAPMTEHLRKIIQTYLDTAAWLSRHAVVWFGPNDPAAALLEAEGFAFAEEVTRRPLRITQAAE